MDKAQIAAQIVKKCLGGNHEALKLALSMRMLPLTVSALMTLVILIEMFASPATVSLLVLPFLIFAGLTGLGLRDVRQEKRAILRNYPISGHARYLMEEIRPKIRQYFFEGEKDGRPFPRDKRSLAYQRAKGQLDKRPFGTEFDVYEPKYEWMSHSMAPTHVDGLKLPRADRRAGLHAEI